MRVIRPSSWSVLLVLSALSCGQTPAPTETPTPTTTTTTTIAATATTTTTPFSLSPLDPVTASGSSWPRLAVGPTGRARLSWLQSTTTGHDLQIALLGDGSWSAPITVYSSDQLFANWADFPSLVEAASGRLFVHWLEKRSGGTYAYDARYSWSSDDGQSWANPVTLHDDATATEHGFVSLVALADGRVAAAWLDGREMTVSDGGHGDGGGDMALRLAILGADGSLGSSSVVDPRVCECCGTAATSFKDSIVIVYRDRSADEVRDIGVARVGIGADSVGPVTLSLVHADGWKIEGCPVNGPAIAANGATIAVAWYTSADDRSRVQIAFSGAEGAFDQPIEVAGEPALGRVDVAVLADGTALVSWLEDSADDGRIILRRIARDGSMGAAQVVATTSSARRSGFPRLALHGDAVLLAWTEVDETSRVRAAMITLDSVTRRESPEP